MKCYRVLFLAATTVILSPLLAADATLASKHAIFAIMERGDFDGADQAILTFQQHFSSDPDVVWALVHLAEQWQVHGQLPRADVLRQQVIAQYPNTEQAGACQLRFLQRQVESLIHSGNATAAAAAVEQMTADYAGNSALPWRLWEIADAFNAGGFIPEAKKLWQTVIDHYPEYDASKKAMVLEMYQVFDLIENEDYYHAGKKLDAMQTTYAGQHNLPWHLIEVAAKLEEKGNQQMADVLYSNILRNFDDEWAVAYAALRLYGVFDALKQKDWAAVELGVHNTVIDFYSKPTAAAAVILAMEQYYLEAETAEDSFAAAAYQKAIDLSDTYRDRLSASPRQAVALYVAGLAHWRLGNWQSAADALSDSLLVNPGQKHPESIWWLILDCYRNLKRDKLISEAVADQKIKEICMKLITEYPQSPESQAASMCLFDLVFFEEKQTVSKSELAQIKGKCAIGCYTFPIRVCTTLVYSCYGCDQGGGTARYGTGEIVYGCSYKTGGAVGRSCVSNTVHCSDNYYCIKVAINNAKCQNHGCVAEEGFTCYQNHSDGPYQINVSSPYCGQ